MACLKVGKLKGTLETQRLILSEIAKELAASSLATSQRMQKRGNPQIAVWELVVRNRIYVELTMAFY
jgi:hypothetical protein